jgi:hypothetical protein
VSNADKCKVIQWSVYVPLAGSDTPGYQLCTGYDTQALLGVIGCLVNSGMVGPQQIRIEVIREP